MLIQTGKRIKGIHTHDRCQPGASSRSSPLTQKEFKKRKDMCASTTDSEEKNNSVNTALHLSPSLSSSSPMKGDSRSITSNVSSRSICASLFEKDNGDVDGDNINPIFVTLTLPQADSKRAQEKPNLIIEDGVCHSASDHRNSSFLVNGDKANADVGNISETKRSHDSDTHVEVKSNNFCAEMIMLPVGVCQGSTDFAEQMDIFMRCQHPLDILAMFHDDEVESGVKGDIINHSFTGDTDGDAQVHRVSGYHAIPRSCEYCGSHNIDLCRDGTKCERPKSYFPRETPPFCSKGGLKWKEENNVGIASNERGDDAITESDENVKKNVTTMACSAWI